MVVATAVVRLYAPWVHSLKEKRMICKSLITRLRGKFNVSVSEVEEQDTHQTIVLGIVAAGANKAQGDSVMEHVLCYIESHCDAEVVEIKQEYR